MTQVPQKDGQNKLMAILQERGSWDFEKMLPESFPGCFQLTFCGGVEEGETFEQALVRESTEELGKNFTEKNVTNSVYTELNYEKGIEMEKRHSV